MNNNKYFSKILNICSFYNVQKIKFSNIENLPKSDIKITLRSGVDLLSTFTFNYHGELVKAKVNQNIKASHLKVFTDFLKEIQELN